MNKYDNENYTLNSSLDRMQSENHVRGSKNRVLPAAADFMRISTTFVFILFICAQYINSNFWLLQKYRLQKENC